MSSVADEDETASTIAFRNGGVDPSDWSTADERDVEAELMLEATVLVGGSVDDGDEVESAETRLIWPAQGAVQDGDAVAGELIEDTLGDQSLAVSDRVGRILVPGDVHPSILAQQLQKIDAEDDDDDDKTRIGAAGEGTEAVLLRSGSAGGDDDDVAEEAVEGSDEAFLERRIEATLPRSTLTTAVTGSTTQLSRMSKATPTSDGSTFASPPCWTRDPTLATRPKRPLLWADHAGLAGTLVSSKGPTTSLWSSALVERRFVGPNAAHLRMRSESQARHEMLRAARAQSEMQQRREARNCVLDLTTGAKYRIVDCDELDHRLLLAVAAAERQGFDIAGGGGLASAFPRWRTAAVGDDESVASRQSFYDHVQRRLRQLGSSAPLQPPIAKAGVAVTGKVPLREVRLRPQADGSGGGIVYLNSGWLVGSACVQPKGEEPSPLLIPS